MRVLGNESYRRYLSLRTDTDGAYARKAKYAAFAGQVNQGELPGSFAAGEQPKLPPQSCAGAAPPNT